MVVHPSCTLLTVSCRTHPMQIVSTLIRAVRRGGSGIAVSTYVSRLDQRQRRDTLERLDRGAEHHHQPSRPHRPGRVRPLARVRRVAVRHPPPGAVAGRQPEPPAGGQGSASLLSAPASSARAGGALDLHPHPVTTEGRTVRPLAVVPGTTLAEVVARAWDGAEPPIGAVDGRVVPSAQWAATRLAGTEIVTLRSSVAGGDSNPLRVVLLLAVTWAALTIPGAQWGLGLGGWGASLASAGIAVGGQLLVNAIAPLPTSDVSTPGRPEVVYSLTGGRNQARAYQPMPLVLGEHRVVPDLAAAPYSEIEGDDQYLYTAFHFGLGDLQVTNLEIGGTPIASYSDVTRSWPGELGEAGIGRERLLAGDVDTQAVGDLVSHTEWTERAIPAGATRVALDLAGRIFRVNDSGGYESVTVVVDVEIYATTPGDVRRTALDTTVSLTSDSPTPVRLSVSWNLPADDPQPTPGTTWKLRLKRVAAPTPDTDRDYDDVACTALRSYAPDTADYAGQHRLEMKIRASEQLSGPLDQITALVRQQVPTPAGAGWGPPAASSNPAWIFRWFALGVRIGGRLVAGAGLPESRIDDASLRAWGAWCDTQQLRCDHVIQAAASVHDVLAVIAQCGRASPSWSSGRLGVVYEDAARLPSAMITPGNILAGTLEIDYAAGRKVDEVAVRYLSPALDWQYATLRRRAAGITAPEHSVTQTLPGVTTDRQAAQAANLLLAAQTWRRRRIRWQMGPAALTQIRRGDVVWLSHALLDGGVAGRLLGLDGADVALDRELEVAHGDHVLLMLPDGTLHATTVAGTVGTRSRITLAAAPPDPAPGDPPWTPADVLWRVYDSSAPPVRARILGVEPQSEQVVRIVAVDDPPEYHAAATSDLTGPTATPAGPAGAGRVDLRLDRAPGRVERRDVRGAHRCSSGRAVDRRRGRGQHRRRTAAGAAGAYRRDRSGAVLARGARRDADDHRHPRRCAGRRAHDYLRGGRPPRARATHALAGGVGIRHRLWPAGRGVVQRPGLHLHDQPRRQQQQQAVRLGGGQRVVGPARGQGDSGRPRTQGARRRRRRARQQCDRARAHLRPHHPRDRERRAAVRRPARQRLGVRLRRQRRPRAREG